jgi:antirestriction protein
MTREVSNHDDVIDSRDVIARIEELTDEREPLAEAVTEAEDADAKAEAEEALADWDSDNGDELKALQSLAKDAEGYSDWEYGATLIRDSYFQTYAEELADDIGAIPKDIAWPCTCIDWERAARELQMDYSSVDFGGVTYWIR